MLMKNIHDFYLLPGLNHLNLMAGTYEKGLILLHSVLKIQSDKLIEWSLELGQRYSKHPYTIISCLDEPRHSNCQNFKNITCEYG